MREQNSLKVLCSIVLEASLLNPIHTNLMNLRKSTVGIHLKSFVNVTSVFRCLSRKLTVKEVRLKGVLNIFVSLWSVMLLLGYVVL